MNKNLIMACHFTGIYDVNRSNVLPDDDYSLIKDWAQSIADLNLNGIVFHNNFSEHTCAKYQSKNISFVNVKASAEFNPNVYRYFIYRDFLELYGDEIESLFVTDVSDVVLINNPFTQPLFLDNPATVFCGDEPKCLDNAWMKAHGEHLRSRIAGYSDYEEQFKKATLLNCGIIGGDLGVMQELIAALCEVHEQYNRENKTAYTGDMGAFNYVMHTQFEGRFLHGAPVNTVFKAYQYDRKDCWFRHK